MNGIEIGWVSPSSFDTINFIFKILLLRS